MRDPEQTKKKILTAASILFNSKGYKATSISDITSLAGITKGAIYKHFKDKSELEKGCLTNMTGIVLSNLTKRIKEAKDAPTKLISILTYFEGYGDNPPFKGGCPLMNAAIEVDDTDAVLKKVVCNIMLSIQDGITNVINQGIMRNQLKNIPDPAIYSTLIYSSIEGGVMMMKVTDNDKYLQSVIQYLKDDIKSKSV
ncbi:MAG: TetR/AcrR family transcriptional repressor of nem operon [Saprospiraceae bacterium]|jgi:TetR/AcrR family transcriptional repressor of nem operon